MLENETKEEVKKALDGEGADPTPAETPEKVSSPEVKPEVPKEPVTVDKKEEQISNLNIALKEEREARKLAVEKAMKFESDFNEAKPIIDRFKNFITPEEKQEEPITPKYLTAEEVENLFQQKQEEQKQNSFKEKQAEVIKSEISTLEKEWDGNNGKPKYLDEEVLKWQQDNSKLYLSPVEAFSQMKKNEIIDWEVKQRLAGKRPVENVEQPGVSPDIHTPSEVIPKTDRELRQQIESAINTAESEM
ncbi:MAG: hypothetical protein Q8L27_01685 [archaeon]|nr:hypothetical protein [archaeon]